MTVYQAMRACRSGKATYSYTDRFGVAVADANGITVHLLGETTQTIPWSLVSTSPIAQPLLAEDAEWSPVEPKSALELLVDEMS